MHVTRDRPESSAVRWMGCPRVTSTYSNEVYDDEEQQQKEPLTSTATIITNNNYIVLLLSTIYCSIKFLVQSVCV